jgi:hypothetical protein
MTLAQTYLESSTTIRPGDDELHRLVGWTHEFIHNRLRAPRPNDILSAEQTAERFVFDANPIHTVIDLVERGSITRQTIFESIRLPHMNFWIEYPIMFGGGTKGRVGLMVGKTPKGETGLHGHMDMLAVAIEAEAVPMSRRAMVPFALISLPEFPLSPGSSGFRPFFYSNRLGPELIKDDIDACEQFVQELFDCLFLLTVPKVVEYRDAEFGPRKPKVQRATGKPLVEFKRVKIMIGGTQVRSSTAAAATHAAPGEPHTGDRYRYHRVGPFFRTYRKENEQPKVVLLDTFWRGNPQKGIIIHERHHTLPEAGSSTIGGPAQQS